MKRFISRPESWTKRLARLRTWIAKASNSKQIDVGCDEQIDVGCVLQILSYIVKKPIHNRLKPLQLPVAHLFSGYDSCWESWMMCYFRLRLTYLKLWWWQRYAPTSDKSQNNVYSICWNCWRKEKLRIFSTFAPQIQTLLFRRCLQIETLHFHYCFCHCFRMTRKNCWSYYHRGNWSRPRCCSHHSWI